MPKKKGLLPVTALSSFLIPITQRQYVAQIHGRPIYAITNVALIPTSSQADASRAISQTKESRDEGGFGEWASEDEDDEGIPLDDGEIDDSGSDINNSAAAFKSELSPNDNAAVDSIVEDVIGKKVRFDRFAASWLGRKGLGLSGLGSVGVKDSGVGAGDLRRGSNDNNNNNNNNNHIDSSNNKTASSSPTTAKQADMPVDDDAVAFGPKDGTSSGSKVRDCHSSPPVEKGEQSTSSDEVLVLLPKLLHYTKLIFSSRNFYFAYDIDITRPVGALKSLTLTSQLPLHRAVDPLVWRDMFNKYLRSAKLIPFLP